MTKVHVTPTGRDRGGQGNARRLGGGTAGTVQTLLNGEAGSFGGDDRNPGPQPAGREHPRPAAAGSTISSPEVRPAGKKQRTQSMPSTGPALGDTFLERLDDSRGDAQQGTLGAMGQGSDGMGDKRSRSPSSRRTNVSKHPDMPTDTGRQVRAPVNKPAQQHQSNGGW